MRKDDILSTNISSSAPESAAEDIQNIKIKRCRVHNLKNLSVELPREKLVVITGISGSGKSSLAFDTLYAEGQRRYVECMSSYARQYLGMMKKPDVDSIEGLSPAISIEQKTLRHNPRSTVGTVTEIYDYLRLLYAKVGLQYCTECHEPVDKKNIEQIVNEIFEKFFNKRIMILSPLVKARKGHYRELFENLMKQGFVRVRVDGKLVEIETDMKLSRHQIHDIDLVVDRCTVEKQQEQRITESMELAAARGDNTAIILYEDDSGWKEKLVSTTYSCPSCGKGYSQLAPNMFSFNSPYGACPKCDGLGVINDFDLRLVIPDKSKSISDGAVDLLGKKRENWLWNQVSAVSKKLDIDLELPVEKLAEDKLNTILYGFGHNSIEMNYNFSGGNKITYKHKFAGILPSIWHQYETTSSASVRKKIENYLASQKCPLCKGGRLKTENLAVKINDYAISDIVKCDIVHAMEIFEELPHHLSKNEMLIANVIIKEILDRLRFLRDVGLPYLQPDRAVKTLSGGEAQRIKLASQIGSELVGIMYVLDEPSIGLHQHDNNKLIESLKKLRDLGNTVLVVEHDKAMIEQADFVVDIGPGAGVHGGEIVMSAKPSQFKKLSKSTLEKSLTAQYILNNKKIEIPETRRPGNGNWLTLTGARGNNLKNVTLKIPLGTSVCVTGLSGSGKSSLINDTLYPILSKKFYHSNKLPLEYDTILGLEHIDKVIEIDQSPIGRTPRSNPVTYTGVFTQIREFFSMLPESKVRGYQPGRFSFNVKGGRCEECEGAGIKKIEMNFLPEVYVKCDSCYGKRYNHETLDVKYKSKSIADVLDMTVEEAVEFFGDIPKIKKKLKTLKDVGLSYLTLGQQAPTLSGGEAQRVKLATELSKVSTGKTLYLLDEPTTGLHFEDIRILMKLLNKLVDKGNTIIIIEHNLDVIKCADYIIDLGPEGGENGGRIIAQGTPEEITKNKHSLTGHYLKEELKSKTDKRD